MKTDVRTRFTKKVIVEAFLSLLREKPLSKITVKEVCEIADINRSTFYKYYLDCFDLVEQLEQEALRETGEMIQAMRAQKPETVLTQMLEQVRKHAELFRLLEGQGDSDRFTQKIAMVCFQSMERGRAGAQEQNTMPFAFVTGGAGAVIAYWMRSGMNEPPEQVARVILALCGKALQ